MWVGGGGEGRGKRSGGGAGAGAGVWCVVVVVVVVVGGRGWCTQFRGSCPCGHDSHGRVPLHTALKNTHLSPSRTMSRPTQAVTHCLA